MQTKVRNVIGNILQYSAILCAILHYHETLLHHHHPSLRQR